MGKIVLLDELTINQIAAGEVIERPASVVKEMVENSIDAGATNIIVEIKNGGISFIRVSDNGKGIAQDDLEIAFERHATSKIRSATDLNTVTSMGFRGEALASIAAVANVELVSKTDEQDIGYRVVVEAGDVLEKEEMGCSTGTTITVRNLFFNTPVRYKFLRKDYTESGYIEDVITRAALVNPQISFKLINTGKTVIQTNGSGNIKDVVYSIYGKDIANGVMDVDYEYEDIKVKGVIGKPEIARSKRSNQLFFVNKRYIKNKTLSAATEQAYKGLIPIGKFGFVILNLEIDPSKVDVNVHPAKLEVRFQEENKVFQAVYHAIKNVLLKAELVKDPIKNVEENKNRIERDSASFEERLRNLKNKKENSSGSGGLFGFRKQHEKEIEKYNDQESKIKTNAIEDIFKSKKENEKSYSDKNSKKEENSLKDLTLGELAKNKDIDSIGRITLEEQNKKYEAQDNKNLNDSKSEIENKVNKALEEYRSKNFNGEKASNLESKGPESKDSENKEAENKNLESKVNQEITNKTSENAQNENQEEKNVQNENQESKIKEEQENKNLKDESINVDNQENESQESKQDFDEMYTKLFGRAPIYDTSEIKKEKDDINDASDLINNNVSIFEDKEIVKQPEYKFIGIIFKTYIILQVKDEMYILDQHAAHERIMYEKVKKNYYSDEKKDSQLLLLPDVITLTHKEMDIAKENMDIFRKAGFELEEFGDNTIKLTGVPEVCIDLDTKSLFLETLDEINTVARTAKQEKEEKFIATVACKSAVKANMALTEQEVDKLMEQLLSLPNPFTCPHGRPTVIKMTKYDIERKFARK